MMFTPTVDFNYTTINRKDLRQFVTKRFSIDELKIICFDLGIDYEEFSRNKSMFVVEMVGLLIRNEALHLLEEWLIQENISYDALYQGCPTP